MVNDGRMMSDTRLMLTKVAAGLIACNNISVYFESSGYKDQTTQGLQLTLETLRGLLRTSQDFLENNSTDANIQRELCRTQMQLSCHTLDDFITLTTRLPQPGVVLRGFKNKLPFSSTGLLKASRKSDVLKVWKIASQCQACLTSFAQFQRAQTNLPISTPKTPPTKQASIVEPFDHHSQAASTLAASVLQPQASVTIRELLQPVKEWLAAPEYDLDLPSSVIQARTPETGKWLFEDPRYNAWRDGSTKTHLWINGQPGACKTTLFSVIVDDLRRYVDSPREAYVYHYISFNHSNRQAYDVMLRSIIMQLAKHGAARDAIREAYDMTTSERAPASELEVLFASQAQCFDRVYLIIDALDECPSDGQRRRLLDGLAKLTSITTVRALTTSRPLPDIERSMVANHYVNFALEEQLINRDISIWLEAQFIVEDKYTEKCQSLIRSAILDGAHGMFQWAVCTFDTVNVYSSPNISKVKRKLQDMPQNLDAVYERMLSDIKQDDQREAIAALKWLTFAEEPLTLEELAEAVWLSVSDTKLMRLEEQPFAYNIWAMLAHLVKGYHITGSGVNRQSIPIKHAEAKARDIPVWHLRLALNHASVKEYLTSQRLEASDLKQFHIPEAQTHYLLAQRSLIYLMQIETLAEERAKYDGILPDTPLIKYAQGYADTHQRKAEQGFRRIKQNTLPKDDLMLVFMKDPNMAMFHDNCPPIYVASECGLYLTLRKIGFKDVNKIVETHTTPASTPLIAAASKGHDDIVQLLIEFDADVNMVVGSHGTALCAAVHGKHTLVVRKLLQNHARPDILATGYYKDTALMEACYTNSLDIIELLLDYNADVNLSRTDGCTALHLAALYGHKEVIEILIKAQAMLDAYNDERATALFCAISKSHIACVQVLLDNGASLQVTHPSMGSALHCAIDACKDKRQVRTVEVLLEKGMDVNDKHGWHIFPLIHAVACNSLDALDILLKNGANLDVTDAEGNNALALARKLGRTDLVHRLEVAAYVQGSRL